MIVRLHLKVRKFKDGKPLGSGKIYKYLGKLTLGKGRGAGFWYQYNGDITNLNVFR